MNGLFSRLTINVSEATKLKILKKNISPFYQTQSALTKIDTVEELLKYSRLLEAKKSSVESYCSPPKKTARMLEPDLAYVEVDSGSKEPDADVFAVRGQQQKNKCFNCERTGYIAKNCDQPFQRHCYKCQKPNYTVNTCPSCNNFQRHELSER